MANENQNPLFAYAEARIAAWQAVQASLRTALALDAGGQIPEGLEIPAGVQNGDLGAPMDLPDGAFNGKSIPACIKLYLSAAKKKKTIKDIASALREGGVESKSGNFDGTVNTALLRLKAAGEVLRFKDGWGLSEWYPASLRCAPAPPPGKSTKPKKKSKQAKAKQSTKTSQTPAAPTKTAESGNPPEKVEPRILTFLKGARRDVSAKDVSEALGLKIQTTHLMLGKLAHQHKIQKLESGSFKIAG
jgi:hypothetical protein